MTNTTSELGRPVATPEPPACLPARQGLNGYLGGSQLPDSFVEIEMGQLASAVRASAHRNEQHASSYAVGNFILAEQAAAKLEFDRQTISMLLRN